MFNKFLVLATILAATITCSKKPINGTPGSPGTTTADTTFTNPLLPNGPDPWVIQKDTNYYFMNTFGNKLAIYKTSKMSRLNYAPLTTVWTPTATGLNSKDIWAPEVHYL